MEPKSPKKISAERAAGALTSEIRGAIKR